MEERLVNILNEMAEYLNVSQMKKLQEVLLKNFAAEPAKQQEISNTEYLKLFLDAKRIEIQAQEYAKGFYESVGFKQTSDTYILENIPHINMTWRG